VTPVLDKKYCARTQGIDAEELRTLCSELAEAAEAKTHEPAEVAAGDTPKLPSSDSDLPVVASCVCVGRGGATVPHI
jgi:hypothetical protein